MALTDGQLNVLQPTQGYDTELAVAVVQKGDIRPTPLTLTATAAAKGATTVSVSGGISYPIRKGNALLFLTENDEVRLAKVNADSPTGTGSINLTVLGLEQAIPVGAVAKFPTPVELLQEAGIERTTEIQALTTFSHRGSQVKTPTTSNASMSLPMMYHHLNAGMHALEHAYAFKALIYFSRKLQSPGAAWSQGREDYGYGYVNSASDGVTTDGEVSRTFGLDISGKVTEVDPVPTA